MNTPDLFQEKPVPKQTKGLKTTFLSEDELFQALTRSGFEFLLKSIAEFKTSTKFSTIHFAAAIELFLKAKLMREHWSLLLDKPDQANKQKFFSGDAKTATPSQTLERLNNIAGVSIPQNYKDIFNAIAMHRNKMVHFAHTADTEDNQTGGQVQIAEEQCSGWLALRTLLNEWQEFAQFKKEIAQISFMMEGHRPYLQKVFDSKRDELKAHKDKKLRIRKCPSCKFKSVKVADPIGSVASISCVVCRYYGSEIKIKCPNPACKQALCFTSDEGAPSECSKCNIEITEDDIKDALDTEPVDQDNYFDHVEKNCPECSTFHSVVAHHSIFVCVNCFAADETLEYCGWCSEGQLGGVPEHSHWSGCEFCDGAAGNQRDD